LPPVQSRKWPAACHPWALFVIVAMIAVFTPVESTAGPPRNGSDNPWTLCARTAAAIEIREDLPPHLLAAISKVESGRWLASERAVRAWPWTVTAGGKGQFFATMEEAIEAVRALQAKGRRNIDVGCMQVNLHHHPDAFEDVPAAFDPAQNIAYAAGLLQRLRSEARSWPKAVAYYHSRTASLNGPYRRKVFRVWLEEWRRAGSMAEAPSAGAEAAALVMDDLSEPASDRSSPTGPSPILAGFEAEEREAAPGLGQVQLGAFRIPENARSVWLKLLAENAALLGDLQPRIDVVDRGKSGPIHFLRISPIMNVKLARSICNELLDRAVDCLVVKPPQRFALHGAIRHFR
jgi:Transglycosylase SLT domain